MKTYFIDPSVCFHDPQFFERYANCRIIIPNTIFDELDDPQLYGGVNPSSIVNQIRMELRKIFRGSQVTKDVSYKGNIISIYSNYRKDPIFIQKYSLNSLRNITLLLLNNFYMEHSNVIFLSTDIQQQLKAKHINILTEEFDNDNLEYLHNEGLDEFFVSNEAINRLVKIEECSFTELKNRNLESGFYLLKSEKRACLSFYDKSKNIYQLVKKFSHYGIKPMNSEQTCLLHALLNKDIGVVAVTGSAGTGKTILSISAALEQRKEFKQIFLTKPLLKYQNEFKKINPELDPLYDSLKEIKYQFREEDKEFKQIDQMLQGTKIIVDPSSMLMNRSLDYNYVLIDNAQNLTPKELQIILSSAGKSTKLVLAGNPELVGVANLNNSNNGLSKAINRLRNKRLFIHIHLTKQVRSELSALSDYLV